MISFERSTVASSGTLARLVAGLFFDRLEDVLCQPLGAEHDSRKLTRLFFNPGLARSIEWAAYTGLIRRTSSGNKYRQL